MGADARSRPGALRGGLGGALSQGAEGAIQWLPTLLRGRPRQRRDLLRQPRSRRPGELWLVIVDASASTRRYGALAQAKGVLATLFEEAYRQRIRLAVLHATGQQAQWLWQGQKASRELQDWLRQLGAGGGTPLLDALHQAAGWRADSGRNPPSISVCWCLPTAVCATGRRCRRLPARACWSTSKAARCAWARPSAWPGNWGPSIGISVN